MVTSQYSLDLCSRNKKQCKSRQHNIDQYISNMMQAQTHEDIMKYCSDYSLVDNEFYFDR